MELDARADVQGQRHGVRQRRQPARLRAGLELPRALPPDGRRELVAYHYRGTYLNSPNDVVTRGSDGSIYFTDPDYGRWNDWIGQERSRDGVGYRGVYRVAAGRRRARAASWPRTSSTSPTGSASRPTRRCSTSTTPRSADGQGLRRRRRRLARATARLLAEGIGRGVAGATATSTAWSATSSATSGSPGPGGVWVLTPDGERIGIVETPEVCGSLCWGGADLRTAVPDDVDDRAHGPDARRARAAAAVLRHVTATLAGADPHRPRPLLVAVVLGLVRARPATRRGTSPDRRSASVSCTRRWSRCSRATSSSSSFGSM